MSHDTTPSTQADLLARVEQAWTALTAPLDGLSERQLTSPDAEGWSIKDHLAHIAVWEQSLTALLEGRPRAAAMGVDEATYRAGTDRLNAVIHEREQARPLADVLATAQATHQHLLAVLARLSDADLAKPYAHFQPDELGTRGHEPVIGWIAGNTYAHYEEHQPAISALAGRG